MTTVLSKDIHRAITEKIVKAIEAGPMIYEMPWHRLGTRIGRPENPLTKTRYHGVNVLALWIEALVSNFSTGHWATYRQWQDSGAQVRKGEHGTQIMFWKKLERDDDTGTDQEAKPQFIAKGYIVFNAAQVDGWMAAEPPHFNRVERIQACEALTAKTGARIREGYCDIACYDTALDQIDMPDRSRFKGSATSTPTEAYYATLYHELAHWTGHPVRLNRDLSSRFGSDAYAIEELVAELGSAFLCSDLGITSEPRPDHAAYIADWLQVLKRDSRAIATAAARAEAAVHYVHALQR